MTSLELLLSIKVQKLTSQVTSNANAVEAKIRDVVELMERLTGTLKGDSVEMIEDLVENELASMDKAIEEAAKRIEVSFL